jgi:O-acetyl-ADP-ribose deacetylase (regulator of RNase III)
MFSTALVAQRVDITTLDVDAIVNAANTSLAPGGGVCGAIHLAAGPELAKACAAVAPCPTGEARITPGFRLKARHVVHAVGPRWAGGNHREAELLESAYRSVMELGEQHGLRQIAFPAISTGIYGYPLDEATLIAVSTVRAFVAGRQSVVERVIFACFDDATLDVYRRCGVGVEDRIAH